MDKKISVIIQARMGSTRLPGKVLKEIKGKTILEHVIDRVSHSNYIDKIVVATTIKEEDYEIFRYCKDNSISIFRGSENDLLDRYYQCAKEFNFKNIVRITADCPLHDSKVIDKVLKEYIDNDYDYISNTLEYTYPDGMDIEVFSFKVLEEAWKNAKLPSEREHVTPYIRKNSNYTKKNVKADKEYPIYRLTLDCIEDFQLIKNIYEGIEKEYFNLDDIIEFLNNHKELIKLNQDYQINEGYQKSLEEDLKFLNKNN